MTIAATIIGKKNDVVLTPPKLYKALDDMFHFDFDPTPVGPDFDGLKVKWGKMNYINPPYSNIPAFIKKSLEEKRPSVFLIPFRSTANYWRDYVFPNAQGIWFVDRIKFFHPDGSPYHGYFPIPISIVFFNFPEKDVKSKILSKDIRKLGDSRISVYEISSLSLGTPSSPKKSLVFEDDEQESVRIYKDIVMIFDGERNYAFKRSKIKGRTSNPYTGKKFNRKVIQKLKEM